MSTFNGGEYLPAQLESFLTQTHRDWILHWRDDGSSDHSVEVVRDFARSLTDRVCRYEGGGRLNVSGSFLKLLRQSILGKAAIFAFADQDDVWLPEKLSRGVVALSALPDGVPGLYCSGHILADAGLRPIGRSLPVRRPPSFPAAMTQNIAQGCTMMLNRAAAELVAASQPADQTWHDWWSYIVVTAAGGQVLVDPAATMLYRQHASNQVGNAGNLFRRGIGIMRRGRQPFMSLVRGHADALHRQPQLLTQESRAQLAIISRGLSGNFSTRLAALRMPGLRRQSWLEDIIFRLWYLLG